ncbi:hypothetical protein WP50_22970 [Lactiplantibacillus plantarum]|nr:hypothetical protein WP50_22970 [Lactiplantibacillus plantarum]
MAKKAINTTIPSVAPEPPIVTKQLLNSPANGILAPLALLTILDNTIGVKNEVTIVAPFIKFYDNKLFVQEQSGTVQAD